MDAIPQTRRASDDKREFPRYCTEEDLRLPVTINEHRHLCRVLDLSLGGARLMLETPSEEQTPDQAMVITLGQDDDFAAEMCWRSQQEIGVQFDFSIEALDFVSCCLKGMVPELGLPDAEISAA